MTTILALIFGFILDMIMGDPYCFPHPIRGIGRLIGWGEGHLRKPDKYTASQLKIAGGILTFSVTTLVFFVAFILLKGAYRLNPILGFCIEAIMYYQILATKCLKVESMKVYRALTHGTLEDARQQVAMIVGRDTATLTKEGVAKATIETVAENTSDGVIAPLFFCLLGGPALGFWYKAVNTLDSMIGYKNDKYYDFGFVAAKLDDVANFIPARLAAGLMIMGSLLIGLDAKGAWQIYKRDRMNHKSPNSAQTEAVCAGALGIQLAGDAYYFGKLVKKPTIGEERRKICYEDIKKSNQLLYITAYLALFVGLTIKLVGMMM